MPYTEAFVKCRTDYRSAVFNDFFGDMSKHTARGAFSADFFIFAVGGKRRKTAVTLPVLLNRANVQAGAAAYAIVGVDLRINKALAVGRHFYATLRTSVCAGTAAAAVVLVNYFNMGLLMSLYTRK